MNDISGFGTRVVLRASETFPQGIVITQFADDADPVDLPSTQLKDKAMGVNGDLIVWSKANPLIMNLAVVPGSEDDRNLAVLADAIRAGKGKLPSRDVIDATIIWPDETTTSLSQGVMTDAPPSNSLASAGRLKSNTYAFAFENVNRAGA